VELGRQMLKQQLKAAAVSDDEIVNKKPNI
jgi:hypothetical protein